MDEHTYLIHHGIKGQKWGIRRYQNSDGTLTSEGKKRYYNSDGSFTTNKKLRREFYKSMHNEIDKRSHDVLASAKIQADEYARKSALKGTFDSRKASEIYGKAVMDGYNKSLKKVYGEDALIYVKKKSAQRARRKIAAYLSATAAGLAGATYLANKFGGAS